MVNRLMLRETWVYPVLFIVCLVFLFVIPLSWTMECWDIEKREQDAISDPEQRILPKSFKK